MLIASLFCLNNLVNKYKYILYWLANHQRAGRRVVWGRCRPWGQARWRPGPPHDTASYAATWPRSCSSWRTCRWPGCPRWWGRRWARTDSTWSRASSSPHGLVCVLFRRRNLLGWRAPPCYQAGLCKHRSPPWIGYCWVWSGPVGPRLANTRVAAICSF